MANANMPRKYFTQSRPYWLVERNNRPGVAVRAIVMPASFPICAKLLVVVELAVVNEPDVLIFVCDGLVSGPNVDDAQAAQGQPDVSLQVETIVIRAAMNDAPVHLCERRTIYLLCPMGMEHAANAHDYAPVRLESFPGTTNSISTRSSDPCNTTRSGLEENSSVLLADLTTST
jgi:hypothetical protein